MAKGDGMIHKDIFNEVDNKDPNKPDAMGLDLYFGGYDEVLKNHASETGPLVSTPNSDASRDLYGREAKGEPNASGRDGKRGN